MQLPRHGDLTRRAFGAVVWTNDVGDGPLDLALLVLGDAPAGLAGALRAGLRQGAWHVIQVHAFEVAKECFL